MLSIFHYYSAKERLGESEKTILMLGGEDECQPMILAQRDMIKLEMQFYREQMIELLSDIKKTLLFFLIISPLLYYTFQTI